MHKVTEPTNETTDENVIVTEEGYQLRLRPRPSAEMTLRLPLDVLASLDRIAPSRSMSRDELLRFYIGQGLRQDLANRFGDRVLETAAAVLAGHSLSEEEVTAILQEIRTAAAT